MICPVCEEKKNFKKVYDKPSGVTNHLNYKPENKNLVLYLCSNCGMVFQARCYREEEWIKIQTENYRTDLSNEEIEDLVNDYHEMVRFITEGFSKSGKVLDCGCGRGLLLKALERKGWECTGVELPGEAGLFARNRLGLNIILGDCEDLELNNVEFDVIILWHVLEHLKAPVKVLKKIRKLLKDNGRVFLQVPWVPDFENYQDKHYYHILVLNHLNFFSPHVIKRLFHKTGFEVTREWITDSELTYILEKKTDKVKKQPLLNCQLCNSDDLEIWRYINHWTLMRCNTCNFIFLNPRPEPSYYKNLYDPLSQYEYLVDGVKYIEKEDDFIAAYDHWLQDIERKILKGKLLEIGSAVGYFLEAAKRRGWDVYGVEISSGGVRYCKEHFGIDVFCGELKEAGIPSGYFDCIVMLHTLEHVYNPMELLSECCRVMRPGGLMVIEVPYLKSVNDKNSPMLNDLPAHLNFFTAECLLELLKRCGFVCLEVAKGENLQIYAKRSVKAKIINNEAKAISIYERLLDTGETFFKKGFYLEALRLFGIMREIFEDDETILNNIAAVLWMLGEQTQALKLIEHALELNNKSWDALINLLEMTQQNGMKEIAQKHIERFIREYPDSVWSKNLESLLKG